MEAGPKADTTSLETIKRKLRARIEELAAHGPYRLNPKAELVDYVLNGLARNELQYGVPYCTCKLPQGVPQEDRSIICPCASMPEEVRQYGQCDCALFLSAKEASG